jgi:hypothetical protein
VPSIDVGVDVFVRQYRLIAKRVFSNTINESEQGAGLKYHHLFYESQRIALTKFPEIYAINKDPPESAFRNPKMCERTDLPTPLRPMITRISPRTIKLMVQHRVIVKTLFTSRNS